MEKSKTKRRRTIELIILAVIIICVVLVLAELYNNVTAEIAANNEVSMLSMPFKATSSFLIPGVF